MVTQGEIHLHRFFSLKASWAQVHIPWGGRLGLQCWVSSGPGLRSILFLTVPHPLLPQDYIAVKEKYAKYLPHSAGRYAAKRFRKAQCPIVERLTNSMMMHGRNNGKKLMTVRIVKHAFEIIHLLTGEVGLWQARPAVPIPHAEAPWHAWEARHLCGNPVLGLSRGGSTWRLMLSSRPPLSARTLCRSW